MTRLHFQAPSRLHFGLLALGPPAPRQFGGVGLMVERPGLAGIAATASSWGAEGPLADRALGVARRVAECLARDGGPAPGPFHVQILQAPPEHVGLGVGTQLSLSVARVVADLLGRTDVPLATLAEWTGRGLRSGIGLHGFAQGGLIVDGGRSGPGGLPPLLSRLEFPAEWSILVALPSLPPGLHGSSEVQAFRCLPPLPEASTDRLCRLVLMGLLPAVVERDLPGFGSALSDIQQLVGQGFAPAQGGLFAHPDLEPIVADLRAQGLHGVGQSSWGPALYGFLGPADADRRALVLHRLRDRFGLDRAEWTVSSPRGLVLEPLPD